MIAEADLTFLIRAKKGTTVRQCNSCRFENADDARACARCGALLAASNSETAAQEAAPALPDWMQSMQHGGDPQLVGAMAANGTASGAVATVATLPVQVRRSRGPLLTIDASSGASRAAADAVISGGDGPVLPAGNVPASTGAGSGRLRLILLLVILIAALAYLVLRFGI